MAEEKKQATPLTPEEQSVYALATKPVLDLSLVHQKAIPGVWNQVRFATFPCNWLVIGHLPDDMNKKMVLQGEGPGGVENVVRHFKDDEIQYAGFRVTISIEASVRNDMDEPNDVFVLIRWVGKHTPVQQRTNVQKEMDFMKLYFHNHALDIELFDHEDTATTVDRVASLTAHIKQIVMQHVVGTMPATLDSSALQFDFTNASHVSVCTHYDTVEPFETKDASNAAMTHDALFNAMTELQKTESEEVPYYKEAKERYDDHHAEQAEQAERDAEQGVEGGSGDNGIGGDQKVEQTVEQGTRVPPIITQADMEGEHLQYQYNTYALDHGDETFGLPQTSEIDHAQEDSNGNNGETKQMQPPASVGSEEAPPAPSTTWVPTNLNGTEEVPTDETDMLVLERLKVEEER